MGKALHAGCVIMDSNQRVLLLRQAGGFHYWTTPGGLVKEDEEPWQGAVRNAAAQVGAEPAVAMELIARESADGPAIHKYIWFLATVEKTPVLTSKEFTDMRYYSWHEMGLMREALSPDLKNLLTAYNDNKLPI